MSQAMIKAINEKRHALVAEQRALIDAAEQRTGDDLDLTAEENETFKRLDEDIAAAGERVAQLLSHEERVAANEALDERVAKALGSVDAGEPRADAGPTDDDIMRKIATGELRSYDFKLPTAAEQRVQVVGTAAAGGNTVPETFVARLLEYMEQFSPLRQTNVEVLRTASGEKMLFPKVTSRGAAVKVAENATIGATDDVFAQAELDAYKYGRMTQISSELIADSGVDILGYLARSLGRSIATVTDTQYVVGDGVGDPEGIVTAATNGKTLAGTVPTIDELIDLQHSIIAPYRANAQWLMSDTIIAALRKIKDTTGQYIWQPAITVGEPDTLLGKPLFIDHNVPTGAAAKVVLFGDFSSFLIRDVSTVRIERSDDFAFDKDLVSFRALFRTDSALLDTTGAVKAATAA